MPTSKKKTTKRIKSTASSAELKKLQAKYSRLEKKMTKMNLEKNFLERAVGDLNFHNNAHDGVVYTDSENKIVYANPYFLTMMGVKENSDILEKKFPNYMWNNEREADRLFHDIKKDGFVREREMALHNRDGQPVFAMCSGVASHDDDGNVIGAEIMFCNITSKRTFQAELVEQHALLDAMLQSTPDPVLILTSALDVKRSNPVAAQLFDLDVAKKQAFTDLLAAANLPKEGVQKIEAKFLGEQEFGIEINLQGQHYDLHAAPLKSLQKGWVCVLHNITVRKQTQEMLQHHAFHDVLTQLPNRAYFRDYLQRAQLRLATEADYRFAALFIDLDGLKQFNDKWGHHVGDELLIHFARRLESSIRPGDLVARLGGDEFAIFVDGVGDKDNAVQVAVRVQEALQQPYQLNGSDEVHTTASIGIALSGKSTADVDSLLRNADKAMYNVKQRGGNSYEIFSKDVLASEGRLIDLI
jgi:diguanylate cyclase (GGDEF)-like protein/PAS domain S-box-containing protein